MKYVALFIGLLVCALAGFGIATATYSASLEQNSNVLALQNPPLTGAQRSNVQTSPVGATPTCVASYTCRFMAGATIVPGTTDTGNHTDDGVTTITLPFAVSLYGTSYNTLNVSSNGNAQFISSDPEFANICLPAPTMGPTIFAYWDDLVTVGTNCTGGCGIYTSISGSSPNRIFNIEWRTFYFSNPGNAYFQIRLYEATSIFEVIIGAINTGGTATIGVQDGAGRFTQCVCGTTATANSRILFTANTGMCPSPSATPTTSAQTSTPSATPINTQVPTFTSTPASGGVVNGHLTWQGISQPNAHNTLVTGTLILCVSGSPQSYGFATDANGNFTLTVGLPDGTYHWLVKGGRHISSASPDSGGDLVLAGGLANHEFGTQKGGNTNTDDIVNTSDFNTLKTQFGQSGNLSADFDYNQIVNASDFGILKANFGQAGIGLTCP